jgi:hypothetical protein
VPRMRPKTAGSPALSMGVAWLVWGALTACDPKGRPLWKSADTIVEVAPRRAVVPLVLPQRALRGKRASGSPLPNVSVVLRPDGTLVLPDGGPGRVKSDDVLADSSVLLSVTTRGEVAGPALKRKYRFERDGDLSDADGRGVRVEPSGVVRSLRTDKILLRWDDDGKTRWDWAAWRTVAILSVLVTENVAPQAL